MVKILKIDNNNFHQIAGYADICLFPHIVYRFKIGRKEFKEVENKKVKEIYMLKEKKYHSAQIHESGTYYILFYPDDKIHVLTEKEFLALGKDFEYRFITVDDKDLKKV